ncbi:hypothetical protein ACQP1W_30615 [Spirillospora sp. CA-255316]
MADSQVDRLREHRDLQNAIDAWRSGSVAPHDTLTKIGDLLRNQVRSRPADATPQNGDAS